MTNVISDNSEQFKLPSGKPISRHRPVAVFSSFSSSSFLHHSDPCVRMLGAAGILSLLAGWTLVRDWLWLPVETWSLTWNSPAQSWWGDLMRILSCDVFRVCECELSLCTGSKGRKVSLRQWQSLKNGSHFKQKYPNLFHISAYLERVLRSCLDWLLRGSRGPFQCFDVELVVKVGEMNPLEFIG